MLLKEEEKLPKNVIWTGNMPKKGSKITCLQTGKMVDWQLEDGKVSVEIPNAMRTDELPALAFSFSN